MAEVKSSPAIFASEEMGPVEQVTRPEFLFSAERVLELAKNAVYPVKCEWGIGTKDECGILLGSWALLQKHLRLVHCQVVRGDFLCKLPKCNCQFQATQSALAEHLDFAHLSRLTFHCPVPGCEKEPLYGAETLIKHYQERHHDIDGKPNDSPSGSGVNYTWEPIPWSQAQASILTPGLLVPSKIAEFALSADTKSKLGNILVAQIGTKSSNKMVETRQDNPDMECFPSQSQKNSSQVGFASSQAIHSSSRRSRRNAKQLEKIKDSKTLEKEEDATRVVLDDLIDICGEEGGLMDATDAAGRGYQAVGMLAISRGRAFKHLKERKDMKIKRNVDGGIIVGQQIKLPAADLSQPQPMFDSDQLPQSAQVPKGITFDVMARKINLMAERGEPIDPVRILYDLSL